MLAAVSVPFIIGIVEVVLAAQDDFFTYGDNALIDIAVRNATEFDQLLGPYSRFGWSHPGPLYFYLLAPFHFLIDNPLRLNLGALFLNWIASLAAVTVMARRHGTPAAAAVTLVLGVLLWSLGPAFLRDPWNPAIILLPLFAALVSVIARPSVASVSVAVVGASIAVQAHVSTLVVVAALMAVLLIPHVLSTRSNYAWLSGNKGKPALLPSVRSILVVSGVALLCWLPPIIDQLTNRPGNLRSLAAFFVRAGGHHPLDEAARHLAASTWLPSAPYLTFETRAPMNGVLYLALLTLIGVALGLVAWRQRHRPALLSATFTAIGTPLALLSLTRADGDILPYLLWWAPLLVMGAAISASLLVVDRMRSSKASGLAVTSATGALLGILTVVLIVTSAAGPDPAAASRPEVAAALAEIEPKLPSPGATIYIDIEDSAQSATVHGVAVALQDRGYEIVVNPDWQRIYGEDEIDPSPRGDLTLSFG